jgi:hypothetical protein
MREIIIFPDDDNGDVLRRMHANGVDLAKPCSIDFVVVFPDEKSAKQFADSFHASAYKTKTCLSEVTEELPWDVTVVKEMIPVHADIGNFEDQLQSRAEELGGRNDGWGSMHSPQTI